MRLPAVVASLLAVIFVAGCASTVSPLYLKTDAVTDPAIVGTWISTDKDPGTVRIEAMNDGSYQVTIRDDQTGDNSVYQTHLIKLGSTSFADLLLTTSHLSGQDVQLPWGAVSLHQIVKYQVAGDDLSISVIDDNALQKSAKQPGFPLQFRGTQVGTGSGVAGDTVIISSTEDLRRYLSAHPAEIFGEASHFKRQH